MKLFFLIFLLAPIVEIYFLIQVGSQVGVGLTIALVVFTAVLGASLVRAQGLVVFTRVQTQIAHKQLPAMEILEGILLFVAGALLLTPGFFTDAVGFVLLLPPLRRTIIRYGIRHGTRHIMMRRMFGVDGESGITPGAPPAGRGRIIDVEYEKVDRE